MFVKITLIQDAVRPVGNDFPWTREVCMSLIITTITISFWTGRYLVNLCFGLRKIDYLCRALEKQILRPQASGLERNAACFTYLSCLESIGERFTRRAGFCIWIGATSEWRWWDLIGVLLVSNVLFVRIGKNSRREYNLYPKDGAVCELKSRNKKWY